MIRRILLLVDQTREIACAVFLFAVFFGASSGCQTTPDGAARGLVVVADGRQVHAGPAAFTVRTSGAERTTMNAVLVPGVGELLVEADRCRFVRSDGGYSVLSIFERAGSCGELRGERLCFARVSFSKTTPATETTPSTTSLIEVDGCVDRNELFLDRVGDDIAAGGIAPRTLIERCVPIPADDPGYLRVDDVSVAGVDNAWPDLRFRFDGDGFGVCFLSGKRGSYRLVVRVEEGGLARDVVVAGDVSDL